LGRTARQAVGYKELLPVVGGALTLEEGRAAAIQATLALAKRQRTFFRRDPRIRWLTWHDDPDERISAARRVLEEAETWTS
jgi:tRNA dimethylallyltransferase